MDALGTRDTPTTLTLWVGFDPLGWWTPERVHVAETVAADLSARVDVPGYDGWPVELGTDPHTPVIAYGTGIDGWGYVKVGPAADAYDLGTVLRHELAHAIGVLAHADDPRAVLWPYLSPGEVRDWTASDDVVMRASGLLVVEPADHDPYPPTAPQLAGEVYPHTTPLVGVIWSMPDGSGGWILVPHGLRDHGGFA